MTETPTTDNTPPDETQGGVRLALMLGGGILAALLLLSYLAPLGTPVAHAELARLYDEGLVTGIDRGKTAIVGHLSSPQVVITLDGDRPARATSVRVFVEDVDEPQLAAWRAAGLPVTLSSRTTDGALGPYTWVAVVGALLLAGTWHLVDQARRHRREGSPRQRIADLEKQLQQGTIDPDRYRREVEQLSTEL